MCRTNEENPSITFPQELQLQLESQLKLKNMDKIKATLDAIRTEVKKLRSDYVTINIMNLVTLINVYLNEINVEKQEPIQINYVGMYQEVLRNENIDRIFQGLPAYIESVICDTYGTKGQKESKDQAFIDTVVDYVKNNYVDPRLSTQMIADCLGITGRHAAKKFKQGMGISLGEYILSVRMKEAAHLLINTNMPVNQISENIGIENERYFYQLFKKIYGCTPREFSKLNQ